MAHEFKKLSTQSAFPNIENVEVVNKTDNKIQFTFSDYSTDYFYTIDSNYVKCGVDTILVQPYLETQLDRFEKTIEQSIKESVPKTIVDSTERKVYYPGMHQYLKHTEYIYEDKYKDIVPVIDNSKFYTKSKFDVYVPVEYYGIPTNNK